MSYLLNAIHRRLAQQRADDLDAFYEQKAARRELLAHISVRTTEEVQTAILAALEQPAFPDQTQPPQKSFLAPHPS